MRNMFWRHLLVIVCVSSVLSPLASAGDPTAGKEKSAACQGCHGPDGTSFAEIWPNLAGQHQTYLRKQLSDFQKGDRKDDTMTGMAATLSKQDIDDIAAYFNSQKRQAVDVQFDSHLINTGRKVYRGGNRYTDVPACAACHGPNGVGNAPSAFPALAGQKIEYVIKALKDFRTNTRQNDPRSIMQNIASRMTDNEINSVATYISSLK